MRIRFDAQLRLLGEEMTHMGSMIESAIQDATHAFLNQDVETAKRIMAEDEYIDQEQKKIENICFQLLIQQQPVARDLRTITAAMKMVTDMERIGDHAADISELTVAHGGHPLQAPGGQHQVHGGGDHCHAGGRGGLLRHQGYGQGPGRSSTTTTW